MTKLDIPLDVLFIMTQVSLECDIALIEEKKHKVSNDDREKLPFRLRMFSSLTQ